MSKALALDARAGRDAAGLPPGARVAEYEIVRVLGGGGFGITYLAHDTHLDLRVALKEYFPGELAARGGDGQVVPRTLAPAGTGFHAGLQRFIEEARALASFRHPHIVRVLRYFQARGTAYIVMEYEQGESLKRWLAQRPPLGEGALLGLVVPVLDGLEAVHAAGFLHRDIKPDNIYVRADGSPVLLDFGAARRLRTDGEMTNIISPGYAPFEQYHARGDQGPWTDLYSLGAVMYWMVTGSRPLEAAARVQQDALPPAAELASGGGYSAALLHAIDWSLAVEPQRRPQSVASLRAALQGDASLPGASPPSVAASLEALRQRTLLCTVVFVDLVGYSLRSVDDQVRFKRLLNEGIAQSLRAVPANHRLAIDTGDGAALCFLADPQEALGCALALRDHLAARPGGMLPVRIGLHTGPVRGVADVNQRLNVVGDGINVAQRVMDFAQPGEVLVSGACHDVVSRICHEAARLFRYLGDRADKHGRVHALYAVRTGRGPADAAGPEDSPVTRTLRMPSPEEDFTGGVEAALVRRIGPLAQVLVARERERAASGPQFRQALDELLLSVSGRPATGGACPSAASGSRRAAQPAWVESVGAALARHMGPLAQVLVAQQPVGDGGPRAWVDALALHIDAPAAREAFVREATQALPRP